MVRYPCEGMGLWQGPRGRCLGPQEYLHGPHVFVFAVSRSANPNVRLIKVHICFLASLRSANLNTIAALTFPNRVCGR